MTTYSQNDLVTGETDSCIHHKKYASKPQKKERARQAQYLHYVQNQHLSHSKICEA